MDNVQSINNVEKKLGFYYRSWLSYSSNRHNDFMPQEYEKGESTFLFSASQFSKKHYFLEGSQAFHFRPSDNTNIWMKISMEHWWNDSDRGKPENSEKVLSLCQFVHHKPHMDWDTTQASAVRGRRLLALEVKRYPK
jgi:hypothetical protein